MINAGLQRMKEHEDFLPALKEWHSLPHADKVRIYTRHLDGSRFAKQPDLFEILQNRFRSYSEYNEFFANCQVVRTRRFFTSRYMRFHLAEISRVLVSLIEARKKFSVRLRPIQAAREQKSAG